jgi:hypothetical protein
MLRDKQGSTYVKVRLHGPVLDDGGMLLLLVPLLRSDVSFAKGWCPFPAISKLWKELPLTLQKIFPTHPIGTNNSKAFFSHSSAV